MQRTKERGNCVEVFKDLDLPRLFSPKSTQSSWVYLFIGVVEGEGMLFLGKLLRHVSYDIVHGLKS